MNHFHTSSSSLFPHCALFLSPFIPPPRWCTSPSSKSAFVVTFRFISASVSAITTWSHSRRGWAGERDQLRIPPSPSPYPFALTTCLHFTHIPRHGTLLIACYLPSTYINAEAVPYDSPRSQRVPPDPDASILLVICCGRLCCRAAIRHDSLGLLNVQEGHKASSHL